jgi:hypothetical protein
MTNRSSTEKNEYKSYFNSEHHFNQHHHDNNSKTNQIRYHFTPISNNETIPLYNMMSGDGQHFDQQQQQMGNYQQQQQQQSLTPTSTNLLCFNLMAPTSPAVKTNEATLTYLNQGQNYELKLSRTDSENYLNPHQNSIEKATSILMNNNLTNTMQAQYHRLIDIKPNTKDGSHHLSSTMNQSTTNKEQAQLIAEDKIYLTILRLCFWDRKLQEVEQDEIRQVIII